MVVSITASTTRGKRLPEQVLQNTIDACDRSLALDSSRKKVLDFLETRMAHIAPNPSAIVGSAVAAKLMVTAGGLSPLANLPSCTVRLLGAKKTKLADSVSGHPTGNRGRALRDKIHKTIEKWQEPPPAKRPKPLLVPDCKPKKKGGGQRLWRMKQRYAITDMRKMANRIQFGVAKETYLGDGFGQGYGLLGQALRVSVAKSKLAAKLAKKFIIVLDATVGPPHPYSEVQCTVYNSEGNEKFLVLSDLCDAASHTFCVRRGATVPEDENQGPRVLERPPTRVSAHLNNLRMLRHLPKCAKKETNSHKPQIDVRQRQGIITPKRILKFNEISPSSQSPGDYIHASVLDNVCHGNVGKPTEGRLRAQPADGLHEHHGSVWLVSPAGPVTSGSNSTSAKLEVTSVLLYGNSK
ncbi:hypothetical protein RHMOL_Rhmol09G0070400 [Rhododendron molle]|uniref:Uncharacterized protein n=1 Tax=Rhododendron molle TaxID=49168 RepID=A0ACC0MBU3_RHOML|nr:hypothetical protein RHMOL_Rhmol09G0070400 [Rhododendron molle]